MPNTSVIRISHCRFLDNERVKRDEKYDRVISLAWTYDQENKILKYGAADFDSTTSTSNDPWNKRVYGRIAVNRYEAYPVVVKLDMNVIPAYGERMGSAINKYITSVLIPRFGKGSRKDEQETKEFLLAYKKGKKHGNRQGYESGYNLGFNYGYHRGYFRGRSDLSYDSDNDYFERIENIAESISNSVGIIVLGYTVYYLFMH